MVTTAHGSVLGLWWGNFSSRITTAQTMASAKRSARWCPLSRCPPFEHAKPNEPGSGAITAHATRSPNTQMHAAEPLIRPCERVQLHRRGPLETPQGWRASKQPASPRRAPDQPHRCAAARSTLRGRPGSPPGTP
jgi:hypothetical protein